MPKGDRSEDTGSAEIRDFDRRLDARILERGSRKDERCPRCGIVGFRCVADSEMVALYVCRKCGYQSQILHESRVPVEPPFREYRESRRFRSTTEDSSGEPDARGDEPG